MRLSWRWIWVSSHYSTEEGKHSRHKKGVNQSLSIPEALRSPRTNDKSKAHANWRKHLLTESICTVRFGNFSGFRDANNS